MTGEELVKMWADEIWKDILGYEGVYKVSSLGRVKTVAHRALTRNRWKECYITIKEKILKSRLSPGGYSMIMLSSKGNRRMYTVHSLVAKAFIPNPSHLPCVNHKNSVRHDNRVENLEWCTYSYNVKYAYTNNGYINPRRVRVRCIETGEIFPSIRHAQRKYLGARISDVINHKLKTTVGYHWEAIK